MFRAIFWYIVGPDCVATWVMPRKTWAKGPHNSMAKSSSVASRAGPIHVKLSHGTKTAITKKGKPGSRHPVFLFAAVL